MNENYASITISLQQSLKLKRKGLMEKVKAIDGILSKPLEAKVRKN
jgi:hypothetical protein